MKICLITTLQPAANPRLVKEADALVEAGHSVRVVAAHWADWASAFEADLLAARRWRCDTLDWRRGANRVLFWKSRIRHFTARRLAGIRPLASVVQEAALSRIGPDLHRLAVGEASDLFIAHNLGALPVAIGAGRAFGVPVGFDAEDFHSGQLSRPADRKQARLVRAVERRLIPRCDYVTAAAPGIAEAYRDLCAIPLPTCILNVFPLAARPARFRIADGGAPVRLHWFSQTIGPDRGLEDAVRSMALLEEYQLELHVRGRWARGFEDRLRRLAAECGVDQSRVVGHEPGKPDEMPRLASAYDIGLALEPPVTTNNDILLSNKIFTYLLAGNAVMATRTTAQARLAPELQDAAQLCDSGDPHSLATALRPWLDNRIRLEAARATARQLGATRFNWDAEKQKFLDVVTHALDRGAARRPLPQGLDTMGAALGGV